MTEIQIQYFLETARLQNITHAAKKRYVSQQVVSKQLHKLEEELGFALFIRTKNNLQLTEGGKLLYDFWSDMYQRQDLVIEQAQKCMQTNDYTLRIGLLEVSRLYDWIAEAAATISNPEHPYTILTESASYTGLHQKILERKYDCTISISDEERELTNDLEVLKFCRLEPQLTISDRHPAYHENVTLKELTGSTLFLLSAGFSKNAEKNIMRYCKEYGYTPANVQYFDNLTSLEMALQGGSGFSIIYKPLMRNTTNHLHFLDLEHLSAYETTEFQITYQKRKREQLQPFLDYFKNMDNFNIE